MCLQWSLSKADTIGTNKIDCREGVLLVRAALCGLYRTARNFGGQNFGECPRFCVWRLIFWRPAPGSRIAVIEKQILATNILADA